MSLKEILKGNWDKSSFMKISLDENIRTQIENDTQFLNSYYDKIPLRTRAYVIINSIDSTSIPKCKCGCGKPCAIDLSYTINGFREYSGPECSRKSKTISLESKTKLDDYDWVYNQRITQQKSIELIAQELNISTIPVVKYLKKHNLHDLMDARKISSSKLMLLYDYTLMHDFYIIKNLTLKQIAAIIKCSTSTVIKYLKQHDIQIKQNNSYKRKKNKSSKEENELFNYIKNLESGVVEQGNRKILNGKEIDIFIPKKKIAIEYDGIYSHIFRKNESTQSKIKDKNYHLNKTLLSKSQGINLYHFYSSEWNYEKEKIQDFIKRILHLNPVVNITQNNIITKREICENIIELNLVVDSITALKVRLKDGKRHLLIENYEVNSKLTLKNGFKYILKYLSDNYNIPIYYKVDRRFGEGRLFTSYGFKLIRELDPKILFTDNSYDKLYETKILNKTNYEIYNCGYLLLRYR